MAILPALVLLFRWNRAAFFFSALGLLWLAPAANLLFPTGTIMAERLLYLPALGVAACLVPAVYAVSGSTPNAAPIVLSIIVALLAVRTWTRNLDWQDDRSIAEASVRSSPESFKTHDLLANVLFASDPRHANLDRVIAESEKSVAILAPLPIERRPADPYRFLANCYMLRGAWAKAIPPLVTYTKIRDQDPDGLLMLSTAYLNIGDAKKAAGAADKARSSAPLNSPAYAQAAEIDASAGNLDSAAVALIEGLFVTGDQQLRRDLVELYRRAMDPKSCVLASGPNGPAINPACPAVHAQACAASNYVVSTLISAGQPDVAEIRRRMFTDQFHCQPSR
jgi:tetratricopeptide (TPR) repeat protein